MKTVSDGPRLPDQRWDGLLPQWPGKRHVIPRPKSARRDVTVCIAALCTVEDDGAQYPAVVIASDRLLTHPGAGTEHESPAHKHFPLREKVLALLSDDVGECLRVCRAARDRLDRSPTDHVEGVANAVGAATVELMNKKFQREHLDPLNTSLDAMTNGTTGFEESFLRELWQAYWNYSAATEIIVTGVDDTGAHAWYVDGRGRVYLADAVSCAVIGSGGEVAGETLRRLEYHRDWPIKRALFAVALAKRHAEAAIGVGNRSTSIASICVNGVMYAYDEIDTALGKQMDDYDKACARAFAAATEATAQAADDLVKANKLWIMQQVSESMAILVSRQAPRRMPTRKR